MVLCRENNEKNINVSLFSIVKELNSEIEYLKKSFSKLRDENKLVIEPSIKRLDECFSILEKLLFIEYNYIITSYIKAWTHQSPRTSAYDYPEIFRQAIEEYNKRKSL